MTNNDLVYADTWKYPRYASKVFYIALKEIIKEHCGYELETFIYGKPEIS